MAELVTETNLPFANRKSGKVRDLYDATLADGGEGLLIVATDRISAFDVVLGSGLPGKGVVLTQISKFWFNYFEDSYRHHLETCEVEEIPGLPERYHDQLRGRVMLCKKTSVVPVECIARGYITGSGWKDYQRSGEVCGIKLRNGLVNSDRLDEVLFTPSTKAEAGLHDENISFETGVDLVGADIMTYLRDATLDLYQSARDFAAERGIILADTKFEFGQINGSQPILIDEIVTPDSSRFWPADDWEPGREQSSFDKQFVRNYLETLVATNQWDKTPPGPELPSQVIDDTMSRYLEAFNRLTGTSLAL